MSEYYPPLQEILNRLSEECILVGSATKKAPSECKDLDFVISEKGFKILSEYSYYLLKESAHWFIYVPLEHTEKAVDFFFGICEILDKSKHENRISYDHAVKLQLTIKSIEGVDVLSL